MPTDKPKKSVHYTTSTTNKHSHRNSHDRDSGIGSSSRASLGTNDDSAFASSEHSAESQRQSPRALREALDAATDRLARVTEANADLDGMLKRSNEERRGYKREAEGLLAENEKLGKEIDKVVRENRRLVEENERLRRREKEGSGSPRSKTSTTSQSHSRTVPAPPGRSSSKRDKEREEIPRSHQAYPHPPQVRIRDPGETTTRSRRNSFSAGPSPEAPQPVQNPFFPHGSGLPTSRSVASSGAPLMASSYSNVNFAPPYIPTTAPPGSGYVAANSPVTPVHDGRYHAFPIR